MWSMSVLLRSTVSLGETNSVNIPEVQKLVSYY